MAKTGNSWIAIKYKVSNELWWKKECQFYLAYLLAQFLASIGRTAKK